MPVVEVDVAVIGAGPAGLAAAVAAAVGGARTALIDEKRDVGGHGWARDVAAALADDPEDEEDYSAPLHREAAALKRSFGAASGTLLSRARIVDVSWPGDVVLVRDDAPLRVRARALVLAPGARELFLPFPAWTLPGVFGLGGIMAHVRAGADVSGRTAVVAGSGPLLVPAARLLRARGARVLAVAEQRGAPGAGFLAHGGLRGAVEGLLRRAALLGVRRLADSHPLEARGDGRLEAVRLKVGESEEVLACDLLACAFGLVPEDRLTRYLGLEQGDGGGVRVDRLQRTSREGVFAAGDVCGPAGAIVARLEGAIAGRGAAGLAPAAEDLRRRDALRARIAQPVLRDALRGLPDGDTVVCRCEDVTWGVASRVLGPRDARVLHGAATGACQGRVCGPTLAFLGLPGVETPRPPLCPLEIGLLGRALRKP